MKRLLLILTIALLATSAASAQTGDPMIIHLKSGMELRGHITEDSSDNIEITTENGDIFIYRKDEILRIKVDKESKKIQQELSRQELLEAKRQKHDYEVEIAKQRKEEERTQRLLEEQKKPHKQEANQQEPSIITIRRFGPYIF